MRSAFSARNYSTFSLSDLFRARFQGMSDGINSICSSPLREQIDLTKNVGENYACNQRYAHLSNRKCLKHYEIFDAS